MSKPGHHWDQDKEATVYVGNLDERVTDALVWELMLQAGRIVNVYLPKDRVTQTHQGFGFVEFKSEEDAEYAARIMNQVRLYGKPIRVNKASADKQRTAEIGAELHVRNLDSMVDEKTLYDTFSAFGTLISVPKIARTDDGASRGFGFISYDSFEAADKAIESMNNQYLMNKQIHVEYAFKKDGKNERHGDAAERLLAAQARKHNVQIAPAQIPAALFAQQPATVTTPTMPVAGMPQMGAVGQMNPMGMGRGVPPMHMGMQQQYPPQYPMQQQMGYQQPPQQMPPQQQYMARPPTLPQAPPAGLPARPPPSAAPRPIPQATPPPPAGFSAYSQPPVLPPGFGSAAGVPPAGPGGLPPRPPQPMGFPAAPPPGFGPPGPVPQGRGAHAPPPPMPPAGFNGYAQRR